MINVLEVMLQVKQIWAKAQLQLHEKQQFVRYFPLVLKHILVV
jgi:hypothetical protein